MEDALEPFVILPVFSSELSTILRLDPLGTVIESNASLVMVTVLPLRSSISSPLTEYVSEKLVTRVTFSVSLYAPLVGSESVSVQSVNTTSCATAEKGTSASTRQTASKTACSFFIVHVSFCFLLKKKSKSIYLHNYYIILN